METVTANQIEAILKEKLDASVVEVIDESYKHAGHSEARSGGHFAVHIVSSEFEGLSLVKRHRLVYDALGDLVGNGIHALALSCRTDS